MGWSMAVSYTAVRGAIAACAMLLPVPVIAQYIGAPPPPMPAAPVGLENPTNALARNIRILAQRPRDFTALVGAGRAALATGNAEASIGFFGRAADVWPAAPAPKAGMGAALVALGEASRALLQFDQAQRLGAPVTSFAAERGLARDLLGQQSLAQADYRLVLNGPDAAEARRRLALSLAISGDRAGALATLTPLLQRSDVATNRVRAFVLALGGDPDAAERALDTSVPGMSSRLDPFFRRLPALSAAQKAAAVHLGIIPGNGSSSEIASAVPIFTPVPSASRAPIPRALQVAPPSTFRITTQPVSGDQLAGIDSLLRQPAQTAVVSPPPAPQPHYEIATTSRAGRSFVATTPSAPAPKRYWVQLANGTNEAALGDQFARIVARKPAMFAGIRPYVSQVGERTKLLVGPFKNDDDSQIFVDNLAEVRIDGFSWTSPEGQPVRKLAAP